MHRNWAQELCDYEEFLSQIDIQSYSGFREIKWVEQDLPQEKVPNLYKNGETIKFRHLHLASIYFYYWDNPNFSKFNDFNKWFDQYWTDMNNNQVVITVLRKFKTYFFDGADEEWFKNGFRARMYRTWMSLLTQIHFQYLWNKLFDEKIESSALLDSLGLDARFIKGQKTVGIQIKKISFRREVSDRKFTSRQKTFADVVIEIPYVVDNPKEIKEKLSSERTKLATKEKLEKKLRTFNENFSTFPNGFVIFKEEYLKKVYEIIVDKLSSLSIGDTISYDKFLDY
ncbi:MAG: TaqI family restriction endonuclease [Bacteroidia bacterium]